MTPQEDPVAGWSSLGSVEDRRLAQSLLDGVPGTLAEIYDFYAPRLFDYCHALLRDQDQAADVLHDSVIAAQEHIAKLREPERFRSWLYAIVRGECLRTLTDPERPGVRQEAPEESDDAFLDAAERQRREETRQLVHSALAGLSSREREALDLATRHDLSVEELSGVLGTSAQEATQLVRRARDGLDGILSAALIARLSDCPSVSALVEGQGWPPPPEASRRLVRHIESCPTCGEHRRRRVSTTRLMRVLPVAAIPSELRMAVLSLADAPERHERRTLIAQRAEPFDVWGWPTGPADARARDQKRRGGPRLLPAIGAAAAVILLVGGVFLLARGPSSSAPRHVTPSPALAAPSDPLSGGPSPSESAVSPTPTTSSPSPTHTTHHPSPTPVRTHPDPKPSRTVSRTPTPTPAGTLTVTDCTMRLEKSECSFKITARDGQVTWTVTGTDGVDAVTPDHGVLAKGRSATVVASRTDTCKDGSGSGTVSFSPAGTATITWHCLFG
jgi:RNA polymerase sigma factor (sigma-70 family)